MAITLDRKALETEDKLKKMFKNGRGEFINKNINSFLNEIDTVLCPDGEWIDNIKAQFTEDQLTAFNDGIAKGREFKAWVESMQPIVAEIDILESLK